MTQEYAGYLAHHGVQGQKWGVRNWQNEDGSYTEEGKHHYGWGYGYQRGQGSPPVSGKRVVRQRWQRESRQQNAVVQQRRELSEQEKAERKSRARKIIIAGAAVTLAAIIGARKAGISIQNRMKKQYTNEWLKGRSESVRDNWIIRDFAKARADAKYDTRRKAVSDFIRQRRWR